MLGLWVLSVPEYQLQCYALMLGVMASPTSHGSTASECIALDAESYTTCSHVVRTSACHAGSVGALIA